MESLVNYESDDGDKKYKKRKVHSKVNRVDNIHARARVCVYIAQIN